MARGAPPCRDAPRISLTSFAADKPDSVGAITRAAVFISLGAPESAPPCAARLAPHAQDATNPGLSGGPPSPLFSLAPDWVFRAAVVASGAVGSYPTFSPLPCASRLSADRTRRYILCDTVRHGALTRRARAFTRNPALRCPDFPLRGSKNSERRPGPETRGRNRPHDRTGRKW